MALPVAGHAAMAALIAGRQAVVGGATQGEVQQHVIGCIFVNNHLLLC